MDIFKGPFEENKEKENEKKGNQIQQWVKGVLNFSSEYGSNGWSAKKVIGTPKVYPNYGDNNAAWAHRSTTAPLDPEFIEVEFENPGFPISISVYETFNPGALVRVFCKQCTAKGKIKSHKWIPLYSGNTETGITQSRIKTIQLRSVKFPTNILRIEMNCVGRNSWYEIDAIKYISKFVPVEFDSSLGKDLGTFFDRKDFADVTFEFKDGKQLFAHKVILSARSKVFKKMFIGKFIEGNEHHSLVKIDQFSHEIFSLFLQYLYSGSTKIADYQIIELYMCADFYFLEDLLDYLVEIFEKQINEENCIQLFKQTDQFHCSKLKEESLLFICMNFAKAVKNKAFQTLSKEQLLEITTEYGKSNE